MSTLAARSASLFIVLALAACNLEGGTGFIQLKTVPVSVAGQPALYLDSEKLEPLKKGEGILTRKVGSTKLQMEGPGGQLTALCDIVVAKNRITTVTVSVAERPPRCQCRTGADQGSRSPRTCIS